MSLDENLKSRIALLNGLRAEVIGPNPQGKPDPVVRKQLMTYDEFHRPRVQSDGEEILWQDRPVKRYGAAVLYPAGVSELAEGTDIAVSAGVSSDEDNSSRETAVAAAEKIGARRGEADDDGDYDISLANSFRPSAVGLSFVIDLSKTNDFSIRIEHSARLSGSEIQRHPSGYYQRLPVLVGDKAYERSLWLRRPLVDEKGQVPTVTVTADSLYASAQPVVHSVSGPFAQLQLVVIARTWPGMPSEHHRLLTVSLINRRKPAERSIDEHCLFQAGFVISGRPGSGCIRPYPETILPGERDASPISDENINRVLYRHAHTFAIGHGCAADWESGQPAEVDSVWTDYMPMYELPATSADLEQQNSSGDWQSLAVSMRKLAGLIPGDDGIADVERLVEAYASWIYGRREEMSQLTLEQQKTAPFLIERGEICLRRMRAGLLLITADADVGKAFRLANHAMILAQLRAASATRQPQLSGGGVLAGWVPTFEVVDAAGGDMERGFWRPFQLAFLLMSLSGITGKAPDEREIVDLIWFPTGGGKTEAYLGLTAFTVFFNALTGRKSAGATVLMRYTLRLLTAQQFQRAATLFCAMEVLRRTHSELGTRVFRIGLWVGGSTTPNKRADAVNALKKLQKDATAENPFVLLRCPWCAAEFGPVSYGNNKSLVFGYAEHRGPGINSVMYRCGDTRCDFGGTTDIKPSARPLPITVIDEDLYAEPADLIIGTVDKFALLAWTPQARRLFGIDDKGNHTGLPPSLIIQDELHLISGPLGSMVGAYEAVIENLCTSADGIRPKIVASTATISRADQQIRNLYGRNEVCLFPPVGLDAADSFFAKQARFRDGSLQPGRLYVGVLAPGHGSLQTTQVRCFASLMQGAASVGDTADKADPWWTLLVFFNSIRELGGAATLFASDIREYLRVLQSRCGSDIARTRKLTNVEELTSRIRSDEVPKILAMLEQKIQTIDARTRQPLPVKVIDACLASNIIEVGVDVPRLAMMAVVGQPKTTSQYIQVTSRVGRKADRPGLVTVLYGQTKPRDRSHYERFRSYHQKLYAHVEPTSVTPFSPPAMDRALHGLIAALVRQKGRLQYEAQTPDPYPLEEGSPLRDLIQNVLSERVSAVAPEELSGVMDRMVDRLEEWRAWNPQTYGDFGPPPENASLMHPAGTKMPATWNNHSWATLSSLRNVDANCEAAVTGWFNEVREQDV